MRPVAAGECNPPPEGDGKGGPARESRPLALPGTRRAEPEVGAARGGSSLRGSGMREANPAAARVGWGFVRPPACPHRPSGVQGGEKGGTSDCDALPGEQRVAERS